MVRYPQLRQLDNSCLYQVKYLWLLFGNFRTSLYLQPVLELSNKLGKTQVRETFYSPFSLSQIFQCPTQLPAYIAPQMQVSCIVSTFPNYLHVMKFLFFKFTYPIITYQEINSRLETRRRSVCLWVMHTFMLKCVLQYFYPFLFEIFWEF